MLEKSGVFGQFPKLVLAWVDSLRVDPPVPGHTGPGRPDPGLQPFPSGPLKLELSWRGNLIPESLPNDKSLAYGTLNNSEPRNIP